MMSLVKNSLLLNTCAKPQTPLAAFTQMISTHWSFTKAPSPAPSESELSSESKTSPTSDPESLEECTCLTKKGWFAKNEKIKFAKWCCQWHTTAQSAEIHSFGVHLSTWLTVGKERARMSRLPEIFFPRYGVAHGCAQEPTSGSAVKFRGESVCKNRPLVPRSNIASSWTRGGEGTAGTHRHTHKRRRRRCGPPIGRTRSPAPCGLPAPNNWEALFVSSPWSPERRHTPAVCCRYRSGSRGGGLGGNRPHSRLAANPKRVGARAGCQPLAHQVLPKAGVWPAGHVRPSPTRSHRLPHKGWA